MTTRLFNPGPGTFVSPAGGVFAPGDHFDAELTDTVHKAVERGRLLIIDVVDESPELPPAPADVAPLPPVDAADQLVEVDVPKPGPPAKKTAPAKTEKKD